MSNAEERARTARELVDRARRLLADTDLLGLLRGRFGEVVVTGSAGYDLMVWPDIDIHMPARATAHLEWSGFLHDIAEHLESGGCRLHKALYLDDYVEPDPLGAGLYWGLTFRDPGGKEWKSDIWGWDPPDYAVRQARDADLRKALEAADRELILKLKSQARARENYYGPVVGSWDIYQFAIARAGTTLAELEAWKRAR